MQRSQYQSRGQLVLELERRGRPVPVEQSEALADLLLAALGMEDTMSTSKGSVDEQKNHG